MFLKAVQVVARGGDDFIEQFEHRDLVEKKKTVNHTRTSFFATF